MTRFVVAVALGLAIPAVAAADPINSLGALKANEFGCPCGSDTGTYDAPGHISGGGGSGSGFWFSGISMPLFGGGSSGAGVAPGGSTVSAPGLPALPGVQTNSNPAGSGGGGDLSLNLLESARFTDTPASVTSYEPRWLTPVGHEAGEDTPGDVVDLEETASFIGAISATEVTRFVPLTANLDTQDDLPVAHASEPATLLLLGSGLLWQARRRRARKH